MALPNLAALFQLLPQAAAKFLADKGIRITGPYWELDGPLHSQVFTVANLAKLDVLTDIKAAVQKAIDAGKTERWFRGELIDTLRRKGWWGPAVAVDPITQEARLVQQGSLRRLQTIYRTNLQSSYMAGRHRQALEEADRAPFVQYLAVMDSRVRPAHAAMNEKIFRLDSPAWAIIAPPNGYNCRCRFRNLSQRELDKRGLRLAEDVRILERSVKGPVDPLTGEGPARLIERGVSVPDLAKPGERLTLWADRGWDHLPGSDGAERALVDQVMAKAASLSDGIREAVVAELRRAKVPPPALPAGQAILVDEADAYAVAAAGGAHRGLLDAYRDRPRPMIERAIASLRRQIAAHEAKINDPDAYLGPGVDPRQRAHLIERKWPRDIELFSVQIDVLMGLLKEKTDG